jgi:hypothetical protein
MELGTGDWRDGPVRKTSVCLLHLPKVMPPRSTVGIGANFVRSMFVNVGEVLTLTKQYEYHLVSKVPKESLAKVTLQSANDVCSRLASPKEPPFIGVSPKRRIYNMLKPTV